MIKRCPLLLTYVEIYELLDIIDFNIIFLNIKICFIPANKIIITLKF